MMQPARGRVAGGSIGLGSQLSPSGWPLNDSNGVAVPVGTTSS
jgi:hypothetical protein